MKRNILLLLIAGCIYCIVFLLNMDTKTLILPSDYDTRQPYMHVHDASAVYVAVGMFTLFTLFFVTALFTNKK